MRTISDRVFERISQLGMTQKDFSLATGIKQSTISEWKAKGTNPSSDKIMPICKTLKVSPEWLLSGVDTTRKRGSKQEFLVIDKKSDLGILVEQYKSLDTGARGRIMGYIAAMQAMEEKDWLLKGKA